MDSTNINCARPEKTCDTYTPVVLIKIARISMDAHPNAMLTTRGPFTPIRSITFPALMDKNNGKKENSATINPISAWPTPK